jgi:hypothetical protein
LERANRVHDNIEALNDCNQRGGRMLSVFDLLEAGTLDLELAAWLMARVSSGASFMVGARPGGAGKTTVMCALANLAPPEVEIVAATPERLRSARPAGKERRAYLCHEIGAGPYFCYLWGAPLRAFCALCETGHIRIANLHADDLDEARKQVCGDNGVPREHFDTFDLFVFLEVEGGYLRARRAISRVYAADGAAPPALAFDARRGLLAPPRGTEAEAVSRCRAFLERGRAEGLWTIEETRRRFIEWERDSG